IEGRIRFGHRAGRRMDQFVADDEVLEEIAGIGFEGHCTASLCAIASAIATRRLACPRWSSSVILPFTFSTPLPAFAGSSKAAMTSRAWETASAGGAKIALQGSTWLG